MLGRYKTAILSKQSTFPGLCRDAAAAGAPGMICAFARVARRRAKETEKKKKKKKKRRKRRGRREKICTVCTLESFANVPPSSSRHFRYVSNRGPTYFHFSQPLSREEIFFVPFLPLSHFSHFSKSSPVDRENRRLKNRPSPGGQRARENTAARLANAISHIPIDIGRFRSVLILISGLLLGKPCTTARKYFPANTPV